MIWLVGQEGMLGQELREELASSGQEWLGSGREVDITDQAAVADFAKGKRFDWIVNCAAYTDVDKAETESDLAEASNVEGPRNLARLADSVGAKLIHMSTDYVFSGNAREPLGENDPVGPQGVYARTKERGETAVLQACRRAIILRTSWLYGKYGPNFVYTMLRLMREKAELRVVCDQRGSPTWTVNLVRAILAIIQSKEPRYGIFHFSDGGEASWYDFALAIHREGRLLGLLERDCVVRPIPASNSPTRALRPKYSVLSKDKIVSQYGVSIEPWERSLGEFMKVLESKDSGHNE